MQDINYHYYMTIKARANIKGKEETKMFDPNERNNENPYYGDGNNRVPENSAADPVTDNINEPDGSGEYRYVPPKQSAYAEASYTPVSENRPGTPRYYYSETDNTKKRREKKEKKSSVTMGKLIAVCLVCALVGGIIGAGGVTLFGRNVQEQPTVEAPSEDSTLGLASDPDDNVPDSPAENVTPGPIQSTADEKESIEASSVYDLACTQVVGITTEIISTNRFGMTTQSAVSGSGFIVTADGYIITNYHVIEDAYNGGYDITVMLYNGDSYTASIVGFEKDNDIAVLKIDAEGLNPVTIGDSDTMVVGETAYAVGNPLGELAYTMTKGMVSALDREISSTDSQTGVITTINMFQIDAAVNSGNSGGPVYNSKGEVIGVVTAKYSSTGVEGIGFAIPINDAVSIANELITNGYVSGKAYFGISVSTVSASIAEYYNMVEGAYVSVVDENSCAGTAGLKVGDIITKVDDTEILSSSDLVAAKKAYKAGDSAVLTVYRAGEYIQLSIVFDEEKPRVQETEPDTGTEEETTPGSDQWQASGFPFSDFFGFGN